MLAQSTVRFPASVYSHSLLLRVPVPPWQCRLRATFADSNSSKTSPLATCEHYCHVLNLYTDAELRAVMDVATQRAPWRPSTVISQYKEFQLHGELRFADHIQTLVVHPMWQVCVCVFVCVCVPSLLVPLITRCGRSCAHLMRVASACVVRDRCA